MDEFPVTGGDNLPKKTPSQPTDPFIRGSDLVFLALTVLTGMLLCNAFFNGFLNLGFAIAHSLFIVVMTVWLLVGGKKPTAYSLAVLALCVVISAGFARSDDGFVKFVMCLFLFVATPLGLAILAGHNLRSPGEPRTLLDGMGVFFRFGLGRIGESLRDVKDYVTCSGKTGRNLMSVLLGVVIALPVLLIVVPLLMSADAAFEGLMKLLPDMDGEDLLTTGIFGLLVGIVWFSMGVRLRHELRRAVYPAAEKKGLAVLTVNTVLIAVCLVYLVYLASQAAYFVGGFAGILPEEYTLAQYARRGFFEMAWICAINLLIIASAVGLVAKEAEAPLSTRLLCLFIGVITVFLVATASGKMFLYIGAYGLTRLRVLTQVVMLFLALVTVMVCVRLFVPRWQYMKAIVLTALAIGAAVLWTDVDTQVARYNVDAYLTGNLGTVDVSYLSTLGDGAVPHIARLYYEAEDEQVVWHAKACLQELRGTKIDDYRDWNYATAQAGQYKLESKTEETEPVRDTLMTADVFYDNFLQNWNLEALHMGEDHICLRAWEWGSDKVMYSIARLDGKLYEPVHDLDSLRQLHETAGFSMKGHDNWLSVMESECVTNGRYCGIRGRSLEWDQMLWYLVDMQEKVVFGPFANEDEYLRCCYELKINPMGEWEPALP